MYLYLNTHFCILELLVSPKWTWVVQDCGFFLESNLDIHAVAQDEAVLMIFRHGLYLFGSFLDVKYFLLALGERHIIAGNGILQFNESSTYLIGWLRDYLWLYFSQLIKGYDPYDMNGLSVWHGCSYLDILFGLLNLYSYSIWIWLFFGNILYILTELGLFMLSVLLLGLLWNLFSSIYLFVTCNLRFVMCWLVGLEIEWLEVGLRRQFLFDGWDLKIEWL